MRPDQDRRIQESRRRNTRERVSSLGRVLALALLFGLLLLVYGVWPGLLPDPIDIYSGSGVASCVAHHFPSALLSCPDVAYPTGYRAPFGQPELLVSGFAQWLGVNPVPATKLVWLATLAIGTYGARRLFARITRTDWLAWTGVLLYLLAPIVSNQGGYGALQLGFILVPTYLLVDVRLAEALSARRGARTIGARVAAVMVVRSVALLLDPYSFVISATGVAAIWLYWGLRNIREHRRTVVTGVAAVLASFLVAYAVYLRSVDTTAYSVESLDVFRGTAVDLYALVVPSNRLWWAQLTGLHHNIDPLEAYADGHNVYDIYLGVPLIALALMGLLVRGRSVRSRARGSAVKMVAVGAGSVAFLLALGPSLRIADFRSVSTSAAITYQMPASAAWIATPWSWVYQHLPGISNMRAVWRWELGARLAIVALAVLALQWWVALTRSVRTRWIPMLVAVVLLVQSVPDLSYYLPNLRSYQADVSAVQSTVTAPLTALVEPGERAILYGAGGVSPGTNDYLANFICSVAAVRCYNVGGDKALTIALAKMPALAKEVVATHQALGDRGVETRVRAMFAARELDVLVLVNFDLTFSNSAFWVPSEQVRSAAASAASAMFTGAGFSRKVTPYFTLIRPD